MIMRLNEIRAALKDRRLRVVAEMTGLSYATVWKVATGRTTQVSYEVIEKLSDYLSKE